VYIFSSFVKDLILKYCLQEKREQDEVKRRELAEFLSTQGVKNGAKANSAAGNVIFSLSNCIIYLLFPVIFEI